MSNEFHGYSLFHHVKNATLRTWNRLNTIYNMKEMFGNGLAVNYTKQLKHTHRIDLLKLHDRVKKEGYANVRRSIIRAAHA